MHECNIFVDKNEFLCYNIQASYGEVSEWFKELVLKTSDVARHRGFESHPLRHIGVVLKRLKRTVC